MSKPTPRRVTNGPGARRANKKPDSRHDKDYQLEVWDGTKWIPVQQPPLFKDGSDE